MSFVEQYKDPRWQRKRLEIMQGADFKCQECGSADKELNVHHIKYETGLKVWEYPDDYLKCFCEFCHKRHHSIDDTILYQTRDLNLKNKSAILKLIWDFNGVKYGKN